MKQQGTLKIMGKIWRFFLADRKERPKTATAKCKEGAEVCMARTDYGICEGPDVKGKRIIIRNHLKLEDFLDTFIHEHLHAADWPKGEEWVEAFATNLAKNILKHFDVRRKAPL